MTEHILKTLAPYWDAVASGEKTFDVRYNDRGYQPGDVLVLRRYLHDGTLDGHIEGGFWRYNELRRRVTYVLPGGQFGIKFGHVVIAIKECE